MDEKEILEDKRKNIKIFPFYKMLSWDLLFFYSILFLYLTQIKNLTPSQVLLADTIYSISIMLFQIPASKVIDILGKKHSVILANMCMCISTIVLLLMNNFLHLTIAYMIQGIGYAIKGIAEDMILYDSLPSGKSRGKMFSKINGQASSYYYYIDAISSVVTGFLFVINPYIPLILCLICNIISTIISFKFKHTNDNYKISNNRHTVKLKEAAKHIIKSKRLLCLVLFYALVSGLLYSLTSMRSSIFEELNLKAQYFGIIYALLQVIAGISVRIQNTIHNKFRNRTLAILGIPLMSSCILIGILGNLTDNPNNFVFAIIIGIFILQGILKGAYRSLIVRYLTNFTNHKIRTKLTSIQNLIYHIVAISIGLSCSALLSITSTANAFIVIGSVMTIAIVILLSYMKGKVGLEPEQYDDEDLKYNSIEIKGQH